MVPLGTIGTLKNLGNPRGIYEAIRRSWGPGSPDGSGGSDGFYRSGPYLDIIKSLSCDLGPKGTLGNRWKIMPNLEDLPHLTPPVTFLFEVRWRWCKQLSGLVLCVDSRSALS